MKSFLKTICFVVMLFLFVPPGSAVKNEEAKQLADIFLQDHEEFAYYWIWRGYIPKGDEKEFVFVIFKTVEKSYVLTDSSEIGKIIKKKRQSDWALSTLEGGALLIELPPPEQGLELALEEILKVKIIAKSTIVRE